MKPIAYAFFVTEAEYPDLQAACPGDFPATYAEFCAAVNRSVQEMADTVALEKVYVRVDEYLAWCDKTGVKPGNISRAKYAIAMGNPWGDPM